MIEFGFADTELPPDLFAEGNIISFGVTPTRVDFINEIDGVGYGFGTMEIS